MANNLCLLCGPPKSGKKSLLQRLDNGPTEITKHSPQHQSCEWKTANKYYEANITFTIVNDSDYIVDKSSPIDISQCQAIILTLDLTLPTESIKSVLQTWHSVMDIFTSNMDCCMLVGNYPSHRLSDDTSMRAHKDLFEYLNEWAVEHMFEFIPSPYVGNAKFPFDSASLFSAYHSNELGSTRIHSALQCVMWPNMNRKPMDTAKPSIASRVRPSDNPPLSMTSTLNTFRNNDASTQSIVAKDAPLNSAASPLYGTYEAPPSTTASKSTPDDLKTDESTLSSPPQTSPDTLEVVTDGNEENKTEPTVDPTVEKEKDEKETDEKPKEEKQSGSQQTFMDDDEHMSEEDEAAQAASTLADSQSMHKILSSLTGKKADDYEDNDDDDGGGLASMQALVDEMRNVRQGSLSGALSDAERRERAANTAMKLLDFLGLEDSGNAPNQDSLADAIRGATDENVGTKQTETKTQTAAQPSASESDNTSAAAVQPSSTKSGKSQCNHCGNVPKAVMRCAACKQAYYCSRKCQIADWKTKHKSQCKKKRTEKAANVTTKS